MEFASLDRIALMLALSGAKEIKFASLLCMIMLKLTTFYALEAIHNVQHPTRNVRAWSRVTILTKSYVQMALVKLARLSVTSQTAA